MLMTGASGESRRPEAVQEDGPIRSARQTRVRRFLSFWKENHLQRLVSIESAHAVVKILQRVVGGLHDPLHIKAGLEQGQHALPRRVHAPADNAVHGHALEDDVARVVVDGDRVAGRHSEERECAAHAGYVEGEIDGRRGARHLADHVDTHAFGDDLDGFLDFGWRRGANVERVEIAEVARSRPAAGCLQGVIADVRHDDAAGAAVLRDRGSHGADRPEAGDGHRLTSQIHDIRGVYGVAEGIEERADPQRHVGSELDDVRGRHLDEFGEGPIFVQAVDLRAGTDVAVAGAALRALAANHVHLRGHVVADSEVLALRALAESLDEAAELVAVDARRRHRVADRRVPVIDVFVGAADGRGGDADEHFVRAGNGDGTVTHGCSIEPIERSALDDCQHAYVSSGRALQNGGGSYPTGGWTEARRTERRRERNSPSIQRSNAGAGSSNTALGWGSLTANRLISRPSVSSSPHETAVVTPPVDLPT